MPSNKWKEMAERTTILRCTVGSEVYGLALGKSDRDEKGICIEDYEAMVSLSGPFEQYEFRTAAQRTGKKDAKSEVGDLDLTIYSLRKFLNLALNGNPNMLELLFIHGDHTISWQRIGTDLQDLYPLIVSRRATGAYLGYMKGQMNRYFKPDGDSSRQHLIEKWGYDVKAASHVLRLGFQCEELLTEGHLTLPIKSGLRSILLDVKQGKYQLKEVQEAVAHSENRIWELNKTSEVREEPDRKAIEHWMQSTYWNSWQLSKPRLPESVGVH